jgi:hypothetical protein
VVSGQWPVRTKKFKVQGSRLRARANMNSHEELS